MISGWGAKILHAIQGGKKKKKRKEKKEGKKRKNKDAFKKTRKMIKIIF